MVARWVDRAFFSLLGGTCLYLLGRNLWLSGLLCVGLLSLFTLWDRRRWMRFKDALWQKTARQLKRESWLQQKAERIRQTGGTILYPTPELEALTGHCLRLGKGTAFHCIGAPKENLIAEAQRMGCTLTFHPWGEGVDPSREQVMERLGRDAPKRDRTLWRKLLRLPGNRYLLTGAALLLLSMVLRRGLYWRLLGSLCLLIGAVRRSFHLIKET